MKRVLIGSAAIALIMSQASFGQEDASSRIVISPDGKMVIESVDGAEVTVTDGDGFTETVTGDAPAVTVEDITNEVIRADQEGSQITFTPPAETPEGTVVTVDPSPETVAAEGADSQPIAIEPSPSAPPVAEAGAGSRTAREPVTVRQIPPPPSPPQVPQATPRQDPVAVITSQPRPVAAVSNEGGISFPEGAFPAVPEADPSAEGPSVDLAPRLNGDSEIATRSRIAREMETINLEAQRLDALEAVVARIGVDNAIALYPDLARTLAMSPMGLEARINEADLINKLKEAVEGPKPEVVAAEADPQVQPQPAVQGDPTIMNMPVGGGPMNMTREDVMAMIREIDEEQVQSESEPAPAVSSLYVVAEIYGTSDNMIAMLRSGAEMIKVREGDELPDGTVVGRVSSNEVVTNFEGDERVLRLR